ncbi:MAG: GDSL-type esterase/lipase family protein [Pseudomonadota bacterium]|nr:GDSL-type esterase/lipase family protein [Pseudomonadota bacterium]
MLTKPFLVLLVMVFLSACSRYELQALDSNDVVLAFGDSLTLGVGVKPNQSYPAVLSKLLDRRVINAGVPGEISEKALQRLSELLVKHQPKLVILLSGGNDFLQALSPDQTKQNLAKMIELSQKDGAQVLLVGVPEKKLFADSAELYSQLSNEYQIPLEDDIVADLIMRPSMKSDYVHFNKQGYEALAEALYKKLIQAGAVE